MFLTKVLGKVFFSFGFWASSHYIYIQGVLDRQRKSSPEGWDVNIRDWVGAKRTTWLSSDGGGEKPQSLTNSPAFVECCQSFLAFVECCQSFLDEFWWAVWLLTGFPGGLVIKNLPTNAGDAGDSGLIPGLGRSPGKRNGNPLQCSCLQNPTDSRAWGATVHGVKRVKNDWATEHAHTWLLTCPWLSISSTVQWARSAKYFSQDIAKLKCNGTQHSMWPLSF